MNNSKIALVLLVSAAITVIVFIFVFHTQDTATPAQNNSQIRSETVRFVGAKACVACHQQEFDAWRGSHHDLAMQHITEKTVLGDFNNAQFEKDGVISRFSRQGKKFIVSTDGPNGSVTDYEVKYTFGVTPLQQYLVELPGGRLQALSIAWDARSKEQGGQRWYHLYPNEKIDHNDELHWTKLSQNWNHMCAECHSTNLKKNFDVTKNKFNTTWSEINVACEACHGPASRHINWANKDDGWQNINNKGLAFLLDERKDINWQLNVSSSTAKRSQARLTTKEIDTCARCHARRSTLTENYQHGKPLQDSHLPALLTEQLYHPDGQFKEEDYVYGSFLQSKMFHAGVTCSDCHEPHSLKLRAPGNQVCLQCHQTEKFDTKSHHFHELGSEGASCAECHMPPSNFMVIDARHDHSIRIPRPDLSITLNTPNACNQCHTDKTAVWANGNMEKWYGKDWSPGWHFGETLFEARQGKPHIGQDLVAIAASPKLPNIARATAASLLPNYPGRLTLTILPKLLADSSPAVRQAAMLTVDQLPPEQRWRFVGNLLSDPTFAVRIEAARILSVVDRTTLSPSQHSALDKAIQEYIQAQLATAEHPQSHINLGLLYLRLQQPTKAKAAYEQALKLDPTFVAAYVNLADLYHYLQQDNQVETTLLKAQKLLSKNADIEHAIGLHYVRNKQLPKALVALANAAQLRPENTRYGYVYAVALYAQGNPMQAIKTLQKTQELHPYDVDVLLALVSYTKASGDVKVATSYAKKLLVINPQYGSVKQLLQQLSSQ